MWGWVDSWEVLAILRGQRGEEEEGEDERKKPMHGQDC